jgi:hypothetical protein
MRVLFGGPMRGKHCKGPFSGTDVRETLQRSLLGGRCAGNTARVSFSGTDARFNTFLPSGKKRKRVRLRCLPPGAVRVNGRPQSVYP